MGNRRGQSRSRRASNANTRDLHPQAFNDRDAQLDADFARARDLLTEQALPGIEDFRAYMAEQNRKLEVAPFLDHIEGPQIMIHISRPDGRITATLIAEVTPAGIRPSWDVRSTGRFNTRWTESIPGGLDSLTRESVTQKLTEFYLTDFS